MNKDLAPLFKQLEAVNTELNAIEEGWPGRPPTGSKVKPLSFKVDPKKVAKKHHDAIRHHAMRLAAGLPGWEVSIDVYAFTGTQAGCVINVFVNGQSPGRAGCQVYNMDLKNKSTSFVPSLQACVAAWPAEVDRLLKRFESYPAAAFNSARYKQLHALRRKLNREWQAKAHYQDHYPYGEHKAGWPCFNPAEGPSGVIFD